MVKARIIRLLAFALSLGALVAPSYSAQANTPLSTAFVSQTVGSGANFYFSDFSINKSNFLAQSESVTVTGLLESDPSFVRGPLAGATITISLQKVDPTNSNAKVGAPISAPTFAFELVGSTF